ncbi:MAG: hypothetical protein HY904_24250 [Deltaproteobacteria bacterium]|nr:hypothetical protein [Deltaproteobacteria bacterium]
MPHHEIGSLRLQKERGTALKAREAHLALAVVFGAPGVWLASAVALGVTALALGDSTDVQATQWAAWAGCLGLLLEGFSEGGSRTNRAGAEVIRDLGLVVWLVVAGLVPAMALRRAVGGIQPAGALLVAGWVAVVLYRALRARVLARAGLRDNLGLPLSMGAGAVLALSAAAVAERAGPASVKAVATTVAALAALVALPVRWRVFRSFGWRTRSLTLASWAAVAAWHLWRGGPAVTALAVFLVATIAAGMMEEALFHRFRPAEAHPRAAQMVLPVMGSLEALVAPEIEALPAPALARASAELPLVDDVTLLPAPRAAPAPFDAPAADDQVFTDPERVH